MQKSRFNTGIVLLVNSKIFVPKENIVELDDEEVKNLNGRLTISENELGPSAFFSLMVLNGISHNFRHITYFKETRFEKLKPHITNFYNSSFDKETYEKLEIDIKTIDDNLILISNKLKDLLLNKDIDDLELKNNQHNFPININLKNKKRHSYVLFFRVRSILQIYMDTGENIFNRYIKCLFLSKMLIDIRTEETLRYTYFKIYTNAEIGFHENHITKTLIIKYDKLHKSFKFYTEMDNYSRMMDDEEKYCYDQYMQLYNRRHRHKNFKSFNFTSLTIAKLKNDIKGRYFIDPVLIDGDTLNHRSKN